MSAEKRRSLRTTTRKRKRPIQALDEELEDDVVEILDEEENDAPVVFTFSQNAPVICQDRNLKDEENDAPVVFTFSQNAPVVCQDRNLKDEGALSLIRGFCFLLQKWLRNETSSRFRAEIKALIRYHGLNNLIVDNQKIERLCETKTTIADSHALPVFNLVSFMRSLSILEERANRSIWVQNYYCPKQIEKSELVFFFSQKILFTVINLMNAVHSGNWHHVAAVLADLDLNYDNSAGNMDHYWEFLTAIFSFRWQQFFYVCFERILHLRIDSKQKCEALTKMLLSFQPTSNTSISYTRHCSGLYLVHVLIYALANGDAETVESLLQVKIPSHRQDLQFSQMVKFYQVLAEFINCYSESADNEVMDSRWQGIYQRINVLLETSKDPSKMLVFVEPFVISAIYSDNQNDAYEMITELCYKAPVLLPYVADILNRCGEKRFIGIIVNQVISSTPENERFLSRFPLILYFVRQRSEKKIRREDAELHVRMLFEFLDHVTNRHFFDAWVCFLANLKALIPLPEWIRQEWKDRKSWWPKFHNVPMEAGLEEREQVFDLLKNQFRKKI
uniref:Uncharacterized protein n=1 Tax=Panagrolaimus sp. JU765 TaxID=591449 RepID=A0AC34Q9Z7_9BILA